VAKKKREAILSEWMELDFHKYRKDEQGAYVVMKNEEGDSKKSGPIRLNR